MAPHGKSITIGKSIIIDRKHKLRLVFIFLILTVFFYALFRKLSHGLPMIMFSSTNHHAGYSLKSSGSPQKGYVFSLERPQSGLKWKNKKFYLNGEPFKILSGSMHYFRVVPQQWKDRLQRMKACGLNTVTTYVAWNIHEPERGNFNFKGQADLRRFVQIAAEVGLYVIIRPGPYICAEWEYGGFPSWLLRDPKMHVRSTYLSFIKAAELFLEYVVYEVIDLQFSKGGPVIAFQVENELGSFKDDVPYMKYIQKTLLRKGINETFFSCNGASGMDKGWLPGHLMTANFGMKKKSAEVSLDYIRTKQPDMALFVTEFWSGWFDHWTEQHSVVKLDAFMHMVKWMFEERDVQGINFYMFHGGTNFGFWNGANNGSVGYKADGLYKPTVTSYDYNAPISESGVATEKCRALKDYFESTLPQYVGSSDIPATVLDDPKARAYGEFPVSRVLIFKSVTSVVKDSIKSDTVVPMEMLPMNNRNGQSFGFILYSAPLGKGSTLKFTSRAVRDRAIVYINGKQIDIIDHTHDKNGDKVMNISSVKYAPTNVLEILVENLGRANFFRNNDSTIDDQRKGLVSDVYLDKAVIKGWTITPLEFKPQHITELSASRSWKPFQAYKNQPAVYLIEVNIPEIPQDTFLELPGWTKGVVFVNGFNLGRYWSVGPQKTLYLPAPLLKNGKNEVIIFELHAPGASIHLKDKPNLGPEATFEADLTSGYKKPK